MSDLNGGAGKMVADVSLHLTRSHEVYGLGPDSTWSVHVLKDRDDCPWLLEQSCMEMYGEYMESKATNGA